MSVQSALVLIGMIAAVGIVVDSLELIAQRETLSESGVFAFSVLRTGWRPFVDGPMARPLSWLMAYPRVLGCPCTANGRRTASARTPVGG